MYSQYSVPIPSECDSEAMRQSFVPNARVRCILGNYNDCCCSKFDRLYVHRIPQTIQDLIDKAPSLYQSIVQR